MTKPRRYLISAAVLAACVCIALGVLAMLPRTGDVITKANFDRLKDGMTQAEVEGILGKVRVINDGISVKGNPDMFDNVERWKSADGTTVVVVGFKDSRARHISFTQSAIEIETIPDKLRRWLNLPN